MYLLYVVLHTKRGDNVYNYKDSEFYVGGTDSADGWVEIETLEEDEKDDTRVRVHTYDDLVTLAKAMGWATIEEFASDNGLTMDETRALVGHWWLTMGSADGRQNFYMMDTDEEREL